MPSYLVVWEISIDAASPVEAAKKALEIQREKGYATIFDVIEGDRSTIVPSDVKSVVVDAEA